MIERIRKKYAMTEKGAKDYVAAVFWSVLVNISKMLPVGVLATALSGIVEALTNGTDPRAGLTRFLAAGVLALAALFVTFLIQYKALYEATYRESANRRIRLAEVLRQLPLSFFGNRGLTDLTTTIMGDTETLEKAFSHFYPAMHGALISTALISAGMLLYDWRMALALLWVVPASLLMVYLSRRMEKRHITKGLVTRRAATDAMQEVLECAPEIKACNQPEGAVYRRPEPQAGRGGAGHHPGRAVHRLRSHGGTVLPKAGHRHHRPHGGNADEPRRPGADPVSDVPYRRHPGI